jgi:hypothetical protein
VWPNAAVDAPDAAENGPVEPEVVAVGTSEGLADTASSGKDRGND